MYLLTYFALIMFILHCVFHFVYFDILSCRPSEKKPVIVFYTELSKCLNKILKLYLSIAQICKSSTY